MEIDQKSFFASSTLSPTSGWTDLDQSLSMSGEERAESVSVRSSSDEEHEEELEEEREDVLECLWGRER